MKTKKRNLQILNVVIPIKIWDSDNEDELIKVIYSEIDDIIDMNLILNKAYSNKINKLSDILLKEFNLNDIEVKDDNYILSKKDLLKTPANYFLIK